MRKTTGANSDPEKSGLIRKKDLKKRKKETELEWEVEGPKQEAEREIGEKTGLEQEVEREKELEQQDSISLQVLKIAYWQIFSFSSICFCYYFLFLSRLVLAFGSSFSASIMLCLWLAVQVASSLQ